MKLSDDTSINLETKLSNSSILKVSSSGEVKDIKHIDFDFEAEGLTDFYNPKSNKKAQDTFIENFQEIDDLSPSEALELMAPGKFLADNFQNAG